MSKTFQLQVVAPDKPALSQEATLVVLPGEVGEFGVMAQHMALLSTLKPGTLKIVKGQETELYFVSGGFAEVNQSSVIVLAEEYERADEIDVEAAQKAKKRAEEQLVNEDKIDDEAAKQTLARAVARLKVAAEAKALKR
jgi:F-type H+-transporting ATPase subunit epsilon